MSDEEKKQPLVHVEDVAGLGKLLTVLTEKISAGLGGACAPFLAGQQAKAQKIKNKSKLDELHAEAEYRAAHREIKKQENMELTAKQTEKELPSDTSTENIQNPHARAEHRTICQEIRKQKNIESIIKQAVKELPSEASTKSIQKMDEDWIAYLFKHCEIVSNKDMQLLWAKILAGEAAKTGTFSKRTLDIVSKLDKKDAELFTSLCQFIWRDDDDTPRVLIYQKDHRREDSIYQLKGINFDTLENLESMGLVRCSFGVPIGAKNLDKEHKTWHYHDIPVKIKGILIDVEIEGYCIPVGHVILTQSGRELFPISGASRNDEFFNYVIDIWQKGGHDPVIQTPAVKKTTE